MDVLQIYPSLELDEVKQSLCTYGLELAYERTLSKTTAIYNKEEGRRCRVRNLLLQDEKDVIHSQLVESEQRVDLLKRNDIHNQNQLTMAQRNLERAQQDLRAKSRDNETLQAELETLQSVSNESTKLLTKNLSLTRELASLTAEIDHLRCQATSHQSLLSEKLALQRQLSTIQIELETEKRYTQRAQAKESKMQEEDAKLESRIESLQAELAKERRQREKAERDMQKATLEWESRIANAQAKEIRLQEEDGKTESRIENLQTELTKERRLREKAEREMHRATSEWESKKTTLESRLDAFRNKLRVTKDQLKATQPECENAKHTTVGVSDRPTFTGLGEIVSKNARKRTSTQFDDSMIGTPGDLPARKKNKSCLALPGDKSTFSITPFLNRSTILNTEDIIKDSGNSDNEDEISACHEPPNDRTEVMGPPAGKPVRTTGIAPKSNHACAGKKTKILKSNQPGVKVNPSVGRNRKPKITTSLEKVTERDEEENDEDVAGAAEISHMENEFASNGPSDDFSSDTNLDGKNKKTRRKLFGGGGVAKTLFDDDEGDAVVKGVKGTKSLGKSTFSLAKSSRPRVGLAPPTGSFGAISPLKKEKRNAAP